MGLRDRGATSLAGMPTRGVFLTRRSLDAAALRAGQSQRSVTRVSMNPPSTQAILIVDDDPGVIETFSRLLRLEGFSVVTTTSPEGGLAIAADKHPDAIILDLRMPIVSGLQFLQDLRETPRLRHTPIAIVTGDYCIDDGTKAQIEALGTSVLFKPLWLDDLVALARSLTAA